MSASPVPPPQGHTDKKPPALPIQVSADADSVGDGDDVVVAGQEDQHGPLGLRGVDLDDELRHQRDVHLVVVEALLVDGQQLAVLGRDQLQVLRGLPLRHVRLQGGAGGGDSHGPVQVFTSLFLYFYKLFTLHTRHLYFVHFLSEISVHFPPPKDTRMS